MFKFEHPYYFYLFSALPVMVVFALLYFRSLKKKLSVLGEYDLVMQMRPGVSTTKRVVRLVLFLLAFSSLILAVCNLQTGSKLKEVKREGADIVVCLDVSNSMLAQDLSPNRLTRARYALERMVDQLNGDRLGLVIFAGEAYVQLPITTDYSAAKLFIDAINPGMVPVQGTNLADAIKVASECFSTESGKNKAIVLITDGEDHEQEAVTAAESASKNDIMVSTIGIGSETGVPIPLIENGVIKGYRKDREGQTIITRLNTNLLQEVAAKGNGVFVQATPSDLGLEKVLDKISQLEKSAIESKMYTDYEDQFQWFIALTLLLLFIEFVISERISNWYKRLNLFGNA
jgi:Ca-activated chloride channel family protein